jgi:hypothetical protein
MAKKKPRGHVVAKGAVKRRPGCMYFVDAHGNVRETDMKSKRKRGQGARNDLCRGKRKRGK